MTIRHTRDRPKSRLTHLPAQKRYKFRMPRRLNLRDHFVHCSVGAGGVLDVLDRLLKQVLGIEPITEETAIDLVEPLLSFAVDHYRENPKACINRSAYLQHSYERLIALEE